MSKPVHTIAVTRYVTPLREGGSMPAIVEADDDGMYVLKFRGAGQGTRALVAEWIAGAIAAELGLPVPERAFAVVDPDLARTEGDPEIQHLIRASAGVNFALDYLPGAANFDVLADEVEHGLASRIVWFDAFLSNVDRTVRNPNLLAWHDRIWLIDHGAALYFHHGWKGDLERAASPFERIREHVLLPRASELEAADAALASRLDEQLFTDILTAVPADWLEVPGAFADAAGQRRAYVAYLTRRLAERRVFVEEALRAR